MIMIVTCNRESALGPDSESESATVTVTQAQRLTGTQWQARPASHPLAGRARAAARRRATRRHPGSRLRLARRDGAFSEVPSRWQQ
jgi:hypothetical protein